MSDKRSFVFMSWRRKTCQPNSLMDDDDTPELPTDEPPEKNCKNSKSTIDSTEDRRLIKSSSNKPHQKNNLIAQISESLCTIKRFAREPHFILKLVIAPKCFTFGDIRNSNKIDHLPKNLIYIDKNTKRLKEIHSDTKIGDVHLEEGFSIIEKPKKASAYKSECYYLLIDNPIFYEKMELKRIFYECNRDTIKCITSFENIKQYEYIYQGGFKPKFFYYQKELEPMLKLKNIGISGDNTDYILITHKNELPNFIYSEWIIEFPPVGKHKKKIVIKSISEWDEKLGEGVTKFLKKLKKIATEYCNISEKDLHFAYSHGGVLFSFPYNTNADDEGKFLIPSRIKLIAFFLLNNQLVHLPDDVPFNYQEYIESSTRKNKDKILYTDLQFLSTDLPAISARKHKKKRRNNFVARNARSMRSGLFSKEIIQSSHFEPEELPPSIVLEVQEEPKEEMVTVVPEEVNEACEEDGDYREYSFIFTDQPEILVKMELPKNSKISTFKESILSEMNISEDPSSIVFYSEGKFFKNSETFIDVHSIIIVTSYKSLNKFV